MREDVGLEEGYDGTYEAFGLALSKVDVTVIGQGPGTRNSKAE